MSRSISKRAFRLRSAWLELVGPTTPDNAKTGAARLYYDDVNNLVKISKNGGGYVEVVARNGLTASSAEINKLDGAPLDASFVVGAETGGNTINVAIQLKDADGADLAVRGSVFTYLSDDANGDSIAATAPSGGIAIGTDGLAIPVVANKAFQLTSEADGDIDVNIVEAAGATWYLVLVLPNGLLKPSAAITFV